MKLGKILLIGCLGLVVVFGVVLVGGAVLGGLALHNFAQNVSKANGQLGTGTAACVISQSEASSILGSQMNPPVAVPIVGCTYSAADSNSQNAVVVLMRIQRTGAGQTTDQLLTAMRNQPTDFTAGVVNPVAGVGDRAFCEDQSGQYAHIWVVKGSAVASVMMTGTGSNVDCALAARWGQKVAGKL